MKHFSDELRRKRAFAGDSAPSWLGVRLRTVVVLIATTMVLIAGTGSKEVRALPIFARATGLSCSACHTVVPALNAYGRYVQRTGYAALDRNVLKKVTPVWFGEQWNGDAAGGVSANSPMYTNSFGNAELYAAGYAAPDWTYHVQQWLLQNDRTGAILDSAWVTYNNLFDRNGHLFFGKIEAPAPSPFSQWFDISAFAAPEITVGEHAYELDGDRWGAKLAYTNANIDAEAGWLASTNGLPTSADFATTCGTDKTFQWKLADASPKRPLEYGLYGGTGTYIVSTGAADHYTAVAGYLQRDPQPHSVPGVLVIYQVAADSNPGIGPNGNQLPMANSHAASAEVYEPFFRNNVVLGLRDEYTNDGLGNLIHYGNIDMAFNVPRYQYLHGYVEAGLGGHSSVPTGGPDWRWGMLWSVPL